MTGADQRALTCGAEFTGGLDPHPEDWFAADRFCRGSDPFKAARPTRARHLDLTRCIRHHAGFVLVQSLEFAGNRLDTMEDIKLLKQALPYIKEYRNKIFVIKFGGEVVSDPERLSALAEEIALLHELNIRLVIIHGGGPQLSDIAGRLGIEAKKVGGRRITDDRLLELAKMVFAGQISTDILAALRRYGTPGVGLSGVDGDLVQAIKRPPRKVYDDASGSEREVDFQNVGDIQSVRPDVLRVLLEERFVPVVASLGCSDDGQVLNINADTIASEIAASLPAEKLFLFSNVSGVYRDLNDPSTRYSYLTLEDIDAVIQRGEASDGMIPKLTTAAAAVRGGVKRAHIINGLEPNALLCEVFTVRGTGTMILDRDEERIYRDRLKDLDATAESGANDASAAPPSSSPESPPTGES